MIRIATWNIDRGKSNAPIQNRIASVSPELLVLTEASNGIDLSPEYNGLKSEEFERYEGYPWITIWTKWKILEHVATFNVFRTACCLVDSPIGPLIVYGTIIPYHMAGVSGNRYPESGKRAWQMHLEDILLQSRDWGKIRSVFPDTPMIVAGDFNQTRDGMGRGYGTSEGRRTLSRELLRNSLKCVTEVDFTSTGHLNEHPLTGKDRRNIDHICVSSDISSQYRLEVGAWDNFIPDGRLISDHNGVFLDIHFPIQP